MLRYFCPFCLFVALLLRLRWGYFHIHPNYMKFLVGEKESHFQNIKTGCIVSDYSILGGFNGD